MKWHYTTGRNLAGIIECREIRLATLGVDPIERPAAWFSTRTDWEPTATQWFPSENRLATIDEMRSLSGGQFRIGVADHTAPFDWEQYAIESRISSETVARLLENSRHMGASERDWFVSFVPVTEAYWLSVEMLRDGHWGLFDYNSRSIWGRDRDG